VDALTVRLLPYAAAGGARNMAADEALLESACRGSASLRFYGWDGPTVSLGYFQPARLRQGDPLLAGLPCVRRPSGGATLVHHHELTYALALPAAAAGPAGPAWLRRMHRILADALRALGVEVTSHLPRPGEQFPGFLCFGHLAAGDLLLGPNKVVGSAQRRRRGALLQHGAVLLARSPHAPALPGIRELAGRQLDVPAVCDAVRRAFEERTRWKVAESDWTESERQSAEALERDKYATDAWNARR
jgi:lipoate-protein ligase A